MPPRAAAAIGTWPLFVFMGGAEAVGSAERMPSPDIDSDQFEASSTEDAADDEMKAAKAADGAADAVVDSPTEEAAAEDKAEEVQQEATEETKEQNEREFESEWMNRARSTCSDCEWPGEPCDTEEARAIAELVCEATRAGTTTHCFVGAKRRLEAEQVPKDKPNVEGHVEMEPKYEPMDEEDDDEGNQHEQVTSASPCGDFLEIEKADAMNEHAAQQDGAAEAMELYCRESTAGADAATARLTRHRVDQETERCSNSQDPCYPGYPGYPRYPRYPGGCPV